MFERHWGIIITTEARGPSETIDGASVEASDPSRPKLILHSLYKPAKVGLGIGLIGALPYMAEACERGAYPITDRCAPLVDLPDAIKSITSTSTDSASASMVVSQPRLAYHSTAPNSSGHLILESRIFEPIPLQPGPRS